MKYIILKGFEGFGDRVQSLLYCIKYALFTKRILVVDWTDYMWCDNIRENFEHYFKLEKVDYIPYKDFVSMYEKYSEKVHFTVVPSVWNNRLMIKPNDYMYNDTYALPISFEKIITNEVDDYNADIVVHSSVQSRTFNCKLFYRHIRLQPNVIQYIYNHPFYQHIIQNQIPYICIHLRGGDRMVKDEHHTFFNTSCDHQKYIDKITEKLSQQRNTIKHILLVSDSNTLSDICHKKLSIQKKYTLHTTNNFKTDDINGLHKLQLRNVSKEQIITQMIVDFYFLSKAKVVLNDTISNFSNIAKLIRFNPCFETYKNTYSIKLDI